MPKKAIEIPDISAELEQYKALVGEPNVQSVQDQIRQELDEVYKDKSGNERSDRGKAREVEAYREVLRAKIAQLLGNQLFPTHQAKMPEDFRASARTKAKTAQEILSDKTELQAFSREDLAQHGEAGLVQNIVIDPRRISDSMLRAFGLDEHIPTGKKLSKAKRIEMRASAIPAIKEFLIEGVTPVSYQHEDWQREDRKGYFRMFRITKGKNEGMVLGTQENDGEERAFLTDLHSAYRRVDHIRENYDEEMEKLLKIQALFDKIYQKVSTRWREVRDSAEIDELKTELAGVVESLKFVKNRHKIRLKERVERCITFKDRRDRWNPNSRLAILAPSRAFISRRIGDTGRILGHLQEDQVRIQNNMRKQTNILSAFHRDVETHNDKLVLLNPSRQINEVNRDKIVTNLQALRTQCQSFEYEPYLAMARYIIGQIDEIIACLNSDNINDPTAREAAKKSFVMMYIMSKLLKLETDLIELRNRFFTPGQRLEDVYVKSLIDRIKTIHRDISAKKIAPGLIVHGFGRIFGKIYVFLNEIRNAAQQSLKGGAPAAQRVEALQKIDKALKAFNPYEEFEKIMNPPVEPTEPEHAHEPVPDPTK